MRGALALALLLVAGCSAVPDAGPAQPAIPSSTPVIAATRAPVATAPTSAPTAPSAPAATAEPPSATAAPTTRARVAPVATLAPVAPVAAQPTDRPCDDSVLQPLPAPGSPDAQGFFRSFRIPLPPAPLYDPPGAKRVGLQVGHWQIDQVPSELHGLQGGTSGGGRQEWMVNLDVAQRAAALLETNGIQTDVLPATVPEHYRANAFLAIHADGDPTGQVRGFKITRPGFSSVPDIDDRFVQALDDAYANATKLPRDDEHISLRMRYYYAFNSRRYCHAVAPGVPQAIIEMAYLTSAVDREFLIGDPDMLAQGIAQGVETFLRSEP